MSGCEDVIVARGLTKRFGRVTAVDSLDLTVCRGEVYGFLGLNGAGKTTTLRLLLGLISADEGSVELFGRRLRQGSTWPFERIGVALDTPAAYENLSVVQNLDIRRRALSMPAAAVGEVIELMGLESDASTPFRALSSGGRQRLSLAAALLSQPEALILDEPTNALDPAGILELRELIRRLSDSRGVTVLLSSHILGEVQKLASRIGIIHEGRMVEEMDQASLRQRSRAYLEFRVSDPSTAAWILEERLGVRDFAVHVQDTVRVFERLESAGALNAALVAGGVSVSSLQLKNTGLEEHFMKCTGGGA